MAQPTYPSLFQVNTRILLHEIGRQLGRAATLDDVPDAALDRHAQTGFDWVWFLGVWETGEMGREVSRKNAGWRQEFVHLLPDLKEADVTGSPFAIKSYSPHPDFGGREALVRLRDRLRQRGLKLLLDFVPNHTALDHPWRFGRPEFYIQGTEEQLSAQPANYLRLNTRLGGLVLAHGRDPYFPGWPDTLQLNYRHAGLRSATIDTLRQVADLCDGVRCDMAMLVLPDVFARTWGPSSWPTDGSQPVDSPFWPEAVAAVREVHPSFVFMAEVYWDLEWELQQQGFDYTYDKRLYDRLRGGPVDAVRKHLWAGEDYQRRSVRFLENHDESRAAAVFPPEMHRAAAVATFLTPGMRFFHDGQFEGRRLHTSMHLGRRADEPAQADLQAFYRRLFEVLKRDEVRNGAWRIRECRAAWHDNPTWENFLAYTWEGGAGQKLLVAVNYAATRGQCHVSLPMSELYGRRWKLRDLLGPAEYDRDGTELATTGLYLDMPAWGYHVFELVPLG